MSDDALHIHIVGAGQAEGELKKVAGGYRAIGKAADQAAHSADKVHGGGAHERTRNATISKSFLGGRGGVGGSIGHMMHLGAAGAVAYAAMEAINVAAEIGQRHLEKGAEQLKFQSELSRTILEIEERRNMAALTAVRSMSTFDKGREEHEGTALGVLIKQIEAYDKINDLKDKATRAHDASQAFSQEKAEKSSPAAMAAYKKLESLRDELTVLDYKQKHETTAMRLAENFSMVISPSKWSEWGETTWREKARAKQAEYQETATNAFQQGNKSDNARQAEISEAMERAAKNLEKAGQTLNRSSASLPGN